MKKKINSTQLVRQDGTDLLFSAFPLLSISSTLEIINRQKDRKLERRLTLDVMTGETT